MSNKKSVKAFVAGARITPEERAVIQNFQKQQGLRNFSTAVRQLLIERSGLFNQSPEGNQQFQ